MPLLLTAASAPAQNFTNLFIFNGTDGADPVSGLVLSSNTLYGTTFKGGTNGDGTVFAINTDGTGFTNIHDFNGDDGSGPYGPLVLSGIVLYGTTSGGGSPNGAGPGTVFAVNTDGTGFTNLFIFTTTNNEANGATPIAGLVLSGNILYGTTELGGYDGEGALFAIQTDGSGFTNFYAAASYPDGALCPHGGLVVSDNTLYGVMSQGGTSDDGTVFALNTDGTDFTNLYNFSALVPDVYDFRILYETNGDGDFPVATLMLSGNTLFGTAYEGGTNSYGTVFKVNTDGTGFSTLHNFMGGLTGAGLGGGSYPVGGLVLVGNTLYGTTSGGGTASGGGGSGTVFKVNTDGTGFTTLVGRGINGQDLGYGSLGGLVLSGHTLYGTQLAGGSFDGSVFAVTLPPPSLSIQLINGVVILNWNDPTSTYSLQAAPNVGGVYTNLIGATSPYTNFMTDSQVFFRLQSN